MNGSRTFLMRKGYLLTALAAAVLLAASPGTAEAQSIGFVGSSGTVSETAYVDPDALEAPHQITIRASGLPAATRTTILNAVRITPSGSVNVSVVNPSTRAWTALGSAGTDARTVGAANFSSSSGEAVIVVAQSNDGTPDNNWRSEAIKLTLTLEGQTGISISPNIYTLTVMDSNVAPVVKFDAPSFTLTEGSQRAVKLDVVTGRQGTTIPGAVSSIEGDVFVRVSNHRMVTLGTCPTGAAAGTKAVRLALMDGEWGNESNPTDTDFGRTGLIQTRSTVGALSGADASANMTIEACGDMSGFRDSQITLTIQDRNLTNTATTRVAGDVAKGAPLTVTVDSDETAPTLSFSPTDVTINEGGSTNTVLLAEGANATEVGMVKLMVEGDAMVDLYHEDTMLEEMNGYVMVDMGKSNSARLMAKSTSDPDLMDGDMAYKAWKLTDGSTDANIGEGSWFRVDVNGSTAVPALPLVGQLLLALFLMAGGSRLYRRHRG